MRMFLEPAKVIEVCYLGTAGSGGWTLVFKVTKNDKVHSSMNMGLGLYSPFV